MTRGAHFDWPQTAYRVVVRSGDEVIGMYGPFRKPESAEITKVRMQNTAKRAGSQVDVRIQVCHLRWDDTGL